jgi:hypothetical protein
MKLAYKNIKSQRNLKKHESQKLNYGQKVQCLLALKLAEHLINACFNVCTKNTVLQIVYKCIYKKKLWCKLVLTKKVHRTLKNSVNSCQIFRLFKLLFIISVCIHMRQFWWTFQDSNELANPKHTGIFVRKFEKNI